MEELDKEFLQKYIFGGIFVFSNRLQIIGDSFLGEITTKQWLLLIGISEFFKDEAPTLSQVGEIIGSSRQNVKQLALKLEEKGFIKIEKDKRALRLHLTDKLQSYSENRGDRDLEFLNNVFSGVSKEDLIIIFKGMNKFNDNINKFEIKDDNK
ncbi:MarR family winged helix-turn-helix transcriptional regulator [Clostridium sp. LP20]|uniref:MarR family winged helix-turn-helix transcriptional regulator n=1 Tax=Clostridium sp. LP20 TaxID=3418665 RepID=UPI003EE7889A